MAHCPNPAVEVLGVREGTIVLAGNPNIDVFHVINRRALGGGPRGALREIRRVVREIRAEDYDVVLDFHGRLLKLFILVV